MIGCPVRNRAWILPRYLEALVLLEHPVQAREYCFVVNDCYDDTEQVLTDFASSQMAPVTIVIDNQHQSADHHRGHYNFKRLAHLRNLLLKAFLASSCDYLFSVDSDILVPPHALTVLLKDGVDIVSALVDNGQTIGRDHIYNVLHRNRNGQLVHMQEIPYQTLFQVTVTGAACLIKRRVIETFSIRYRSQYGAEDIGFCDAAQSSGIGIFCDSRIHCRHIMRESDYFNDLNELNQSRKQSR